MSALGPAAAAVLAVSVQGLRCTDRLARILEPGDHGTDKCEIISGHGEKL
jgi:hypothetical protein